MTAASGELIHAVRSLAASLLIGFLIGAERESSQGRKHPGVRDFILIALIGSLSGLLQMPWLVVSALFSITLLLAVYRYAAQDRGGITTEMAALATFCLALLTAQAEFPYGISVAVGLTIVILAFLEGKRTLHKLLRETITDTEFQDTIRFLALIFVIYPLLPEGHYGPYGFFDPRTIWLFVILVSCISYVGYFFERFLGTRKGLRYASVLGGLTSTTAATAQFARRYSREPEAFSYFWQACVLANAMQFPRVLVILYAISAPVANISLAPLAAMAAAGVLFAYGIQKFHPGKSNPRPIDLGNPFRLMPALKFGAAFAAVMFFTKAAAAEFGTGVLSLVSALSGSFSADAVVVSLSQMWNQGQAHLEVVQAGIFLALLVNAAVKTAIAGYLGTRRFAFAAAAGFGAMLGVGALVWWILRL